MRIVLATGPSSAAGDDAIVIDHQNYCFWRGHERFPRACPAKPGWVRFRLVAALIIRSPWLLTYDQLTEHVWGDDPEGGPIDPKRLISIKLHMARRDLLPALGFQVLNEFGRGYSLIVLQQAQRMAA